MSAKAVYVGLSLLLVALVGLDICLTVELGRTTEEELESLRASVERLERRVAIERKGTPTRRPARGDGIPTDRFQSPRVEATSAGDAPGGQPQFDRDPAAWLARFHEDSGDWRHGLAIGKLLAALPPEEALRILTEIWGDLSVTHRQQGLKPLVFGGNPKTLDFLDLAATDSDLSVRQRAYSYLQGIAFVDFAEDHEAYLQWAAANKGRPLADVVEEGTRGFVAKLRDVPLDELDAALEDHRGMLQVAINRGRGTETDVKDLVMKAGAGAILEKALSMGDASTQKAALDWVSRMTPDSSWLQTHVAPLLTSSDTGTLTAACYTLGREDVPWARDRLTELMKTNSIVRSSAASALGMMGDARAIPEMISAIVSDPSSKTIYDVGYFGLGKLTGVSYSEKHDGEWWLQWWESNRAHMPEEIRHVTIGRMP